MRLRRRCAAAATLGRSSLQLGWKDMGATQVWLEAWSSTAAAPQRANSVDEASEAMRHEVCSGTHRRLLALLHHTPQQVKLLPREGSRGSWPAWLRSRRRSSSTLLLLQQDLLQLCQRVA